MKELSVDYERAKLVVLNIQKAFKEKAGLLASIEDLIEYQIPEGVIPLSKAHSLFLFYTAFNDQGMKSSRLYHRMKEMFKSFQDLFNPGYILEQYKNEEDINLIKATGLFLGTRYPGETGRRWYVNSQKLQQLFDGDPRKLFQYSRNATVLLEKIKSFRGYGPKTGGMLLRAIIGLKFAEVDGLEKVFMPVDIHDVRISFYTGILNNNDAIPDYENYHLYVKRVQEIILDTCNSLQINWLDIDRGLWLTGSKGCVKKKCNLCPLYDLCLTGQHQKKS